MKNGFLGKGSQSIKDWFFYKGSQNTKGVNFLFWPIEKQLTVIGYVFLFGLLGAYLTMALFIPDYFGQVTCFFRIFFGVYCPVCGCSRAALYLYTGHLIKSLQMNPSIFTASVFCVPFLIFNTACYLTKGKVRGMRYHNIYFFTIVAVSALDCIYKNWMLLSKGIALIP